jgi:hypothetical protein
MRRERVTPYLVHLGYSLMLGALVARDILWLRGTLATAQTVLALYAWRSGLRTIATWNVVFVAINLLWVVQIVRERRAVVLPDDLRTLHAAHFAALPPGEFIRWWRQGRRERLSNAQLTWQDRYPESLYFLMSGTARVSRDGRPVIDLVDPQFIGEMSLITGRPANADVHAVGEADVVRWPAPLMREIQSRQPLLWSRLQAAIGHDLVDKIRRGEAH